MTLQQTKKLLILSMMIATMSACQRDAHIVSHNLSADADNFKIKRRIVFYNSIQDTFILEMQGNCAIQVDGTDKQLEVTCKTGENNYQKHYLGLSNNVTYTVEQLDYQEASKYHYKMIFKPDSIVPFQNIEVR